METFFNRLEIAQRIILYILILGTALIIWNGNLTAVEIKCYFVQIGVLFIAIFIPAQLIRDGEIRCTRNVIPWIAGLYLICLIVGYLRTNFTSLNYHAFVPQLFGVLFFFIIVQRAGTIKIKTIISILLISLTFAVTYGILQFLNFDLVSWNTNLPREGVVSFFGNKNFLGIYLLLIAPLAIYSPAIVANKLLRIPGVVLGTGSVLVLVLSYSRGALVSFFIAAVMIVSLMFVFNRYTNTTLKVRVVPLIILFSILTVTLLFMPDQIKTDFQNLITNKEYQHRIACNTAAIRIITDNPLWGIGVGNFTVAARAISDPTLFFGDPNTLLTHVHNDFLEIWVEQGILAFVLFISIIIVMFGSCIGIAQKAKGYDRYISAAIAFSVLGFSIYSIGTIALGNMASAFYFWVLMGLGYMVIRESQGTRKLLVTIKLHAITKYSLLVLLVCITFGLFIGYSITKKYMADIAVKQAFDLVNDGRNAAALSTINKAVSLNEKSVEALYQRGFILFSQGKYADAIAEFLHVNQLAPGYLNSYFNLASCYYRQRNFVSAIRFAELSCANFPAYEPSVVLLSYLYYYSGSIDKAKYVTSLAINNFPDNPKLIALNSKLTNTSSSEKE
jgi:O-antigen ligase